MHFLRLVRPFNLIVIAVTMYAVRIFVLQAWGKFSGGNIPGEPLDFFLLVLSTVMIAAGGNIINDYFDVKADRVNKPHKLIITKHIKPRWAIVSHWILNFIAFTIACYLSWRYTTFWYVFVHLLTINALWFYSMHFKRRFLIGNLIIAGLTALVPILCGIHFYIQLTVIGHGHNPLASSGMHSPEWFFKLYHRGLFIYILAIFAFALNFVREIIKDMEDVAGDELLKAKTLPIVLGISRTKWIALSLLMAILLVGIVLGTQWNVLQDRHFLIALAPVALIILSCLYSIFMLLSSTAKASLKRADFSLKIAMMIGCCIPIYWYFIV